MMDIYQINSGLQPSFSGIAPSNPLLQHNMLQTGIRRVYDVIMVKKKKFTDKKLTASLKLATLFLFLLFGIIASGTKFSMPKAVTPSPIVSNRLEPATPLTNTEYELVFNLNPNGRTHTNSYNFSFEYNPAIAEPKFPDQPMNNIQSPDKAIAIIKNNIITITGGRVGTGGIGYQNTEDILKIKMVAKTDIPSADTFIKNWKYKRIDEINLLAAVATPIPPTPTSTAASSQGATGQAWDSCMQEVAPNVKIPTVKCFELVFNNLLAVIISLVVIILFGMLTFGGFKYLTSGNDPAKVEAAKKTMTYAVIGIALIALTFLFFRILEAFTGIKLTIFKINTD
jgi:hypothetical protein